MSERPSILRDIGNYMSGRVLLLLLGFATFPLMTRLLSVGQYGVVSLCLRVILLLTVLSKCGLQYAATRFYKEISGGEREREQQRFYSTLLLGPLLTGTAVVLIYTAVLVLARARFTDPSLLRCLLIAPGLVLLRTVQSLLQSLLRNEGRSRLHSAFEVATKLLTLLAFVILLTGSYRSALATLIALTLSESVVIVLQLGMLLRQDRLRLRAIDWRLIRTSVAFGAPLIAYELSSLVLDSGDRVLILHYLGSAPLGFYSAAYNISGYLQETVMTPLNLAIFPIYMRLWNEEGRAATQRFLSVALSWFLVAAMPISVLALLCSRDVIALLASSRFAEAEHLLPILVPSLMLYATHIFLNVGLVLEKRTGLMALLVSLSAVLNLLLNVVLLPRMGIAGAAWATLFSYALLIAVLAALNHRLLPVRPDFALVGRAVLASVAAYPLPALLRTPHPVLTLVLRVTVYLPVFAGVLLLLAPECRSLAMEALARLQVLRQRRAERSPGKPLSLLTGIGESGQ